MERARVRGRDRRSVAIVHVHVRRQIEEIGIEMRERFNRSVSIQLLRFGSSHGGGDGDAIGSLRLKCVLYVHLLMDGSERDSVSVCIGTGQGGRCPSAESKGAGMSFWGKRKMLTAQSWRLCQRQPTERPSEQRCRRK